MYVLLPISVQAHLQVVLPSVEPAAAAGDSGQAEAAASSWQMQQLLKQQQLLLPETFRPLNNRRSYKVNHVATTCADIHCDHKLNVSQVKCSCSVIEFHADRM